jgi:hypothetical protein
MGKYKKSIILMGTLGAIAVIVPTMAMASGRGKLTPPAAMGTVLTVSGNTITLKNAKNGTTYTINAASATIKKFTPGASGQKGTVATITVSQINTGDNLVVSGTVSGTSITATQIADGSLMGKHSLGGGMVKPGVSGAVSAKSGNILTVTGKNGTTYSVDATNAAITKLTFGAAGTKPASTTISLSQIIVGDNIMAQGTLSDTTLTATKITDGNFPAAGLGKNMGQKPAAFGTVGAVSSNTITLTGKNGTTYSVDATNAAITKITPGATGQKPTSTVISVSQIKTGDSLSVFGTVSGTNIVATKITDGNLAGRGVKNGILKHINK